jgi:hypothetical protein
LLALELALKLEAEGREGNLYLIDSGPDFMKALVEHMTGGNEDQLETNLICTMFHILAPHEATSSAISKVCLDQNVKFY